MYCSKCGNSINHNDTYCPKCGNFLNNKNINNVQNISLNNMNNANNMSNTNIANPINNIQNVSFSNINSSPNYNNINNQNMNNFQVNNPSSKNNKVLFILMGVGIGVILIVIFYFLFFNESNDYYFPGSSYDIPNGGSIGGSSKKGKYSTVIITDNKYTGVKISTVNDANKLISEDSVNQKGNCPSEIKSIEEEIIKKYNVTAVNLCEIDVEFAKEIANVFKKIYQEYPGVRDNLTNLTISSDFGKTSGIIAAFGPVSYFAESNTTSTFPWVIKTQIYLNSQYFLNRNKLESAVKDSTNAGHFPPNATVYSPVAHEIGHYLSFIAMLKYYNDNSILLINNNDDLAILNKLTKDFSNGDFSLSMITEAYSKWERGNNETMDLDDWRGTISKYALAKDEKGKYIYDETIAEAFHDVYLNGDNAKDASKYIVDVLKTKLEVE